MAVIAGCYWEKLPTLRNPWQRPAGKGWSKHIWMFTRLVTRWPWRVGAGSSPHPCSLPGPHRGFVQVFVVWSLVQADVPQLLCVSCTKALIMGFVCCWDTQSRNWFGGCWRKAEWGFPSWMKSQVWTGSSEWAQLQCWGREYFSLHHWVYLPVCLL